MRGSRGTNVILCGFMATGKSSVGKRLAELLGYRFLDMDAEIEAGAGMPISEIFASRGEAAFRRLESDMVQRLASHSGCVIATGGGTIADPDNLETLRQCGILITLEADPETILERAGSAGDRPMLSGNDRLGRITDLLAKRADAYARADWAIDTSGLSIDQVARRIAGLLKRHKD